MYERERDTQCAAADGYQRDSRAVSLMDVSCYWRLSSLKPFDSVSWGISSSDCSYLLYSCTSGGRKWVLYLLPWFPANPAIHIYKLSVHVCAVVKISWLCFKHQNRRWQKNLWQSFDVYLLGENTFIPPFILYHCPDRHLNSFSSCLSGCVWRSVVSKYQKKQINLVSPPNVYIEERFALWNIFICM